MPETANVDILVEAMTESAKDGLNEVSDEFNTMTAEAQPAQAAVDEVADELNSADRAAGGAGEAFDDVDAAQLAASMQLLANRAAEAGEQIASTGRRASFTAGTFGTLTVTSTALAAALGTLSVAATASLIPAILTLGTVLLPLTTILGGLAVAAGALAAAFGAVVAVPAAQNMDKLKAALKEANAELVQILKPMADEFLPLLLDAIDAIPDLVRNILDATGGFDQFADALRTLGQRAFEVIPQVAGFMHELATEALPVFMDLVQDMGETAPGLIAATGEAFRRLGPPLQDFVNSLVDATPALFDLGLVVGETVIPRLTTLVEVVGDIASRGVAAITDMGDGMQDLAIGAVLAAPAILKIGVALAGLLGGPLSAAIAGVAALAAAYKTNFMGLADTTDAAISRAKSLIQQFVDDAQSAWDDLMERTEGVRGAFESFLEGLGSVGGKLKENVRGLVQDLIRFWGDLVRAVRPILERFDRVLGRNQDKIRRLGVAVGEAINGIVSVFRNVLLPAYRYVFLNLIIPILDRVTRVWANNFDEILAETIETINAVQGYLNTALNRLSTFWDNHGDTVMQIVDFLFDTIVRRAGTAMDALVTALLVGMNLIQGDWDEAWSEIKDFVTGVVDGLKQYVDRWFSGFYATILRGLADVAEAWNALFTETIPRTVVAGLATLVGHVQSGMNNVYNTMVSVWEGILQVGQNAVNTLISNTINALNAFLSTLDEVANQVSEIPGVDAPDIGTLEQQTIDTQGLEAERRRTDAQALAEETQRNLEGELELNVSGDGALAELLREEAREQVDYKERQAGRRARRRGIQQT